MAWTEITRRKYRRDGLRYASDTAEQEWRVIGTEGSTRPLVAKLAPSSRR